MLTAILEGFYKTETQSPRKLVLAGELIISHNPLCALCASALKNKPRNAQNTRKNRRDEMTSTVYIAKNVYGGDGLGRLGDGRVIFVPGAWAGEQVKAEIVEEKKHFVKARLVEVVEKSPDRVECVAERVVPGMVYANLSYDGELKAKEDQLKEFLERARIEVPEFVSAKGGSEFNYRNKVVGRSFGRRWYIVARPRIKVAESKPRHSWASQATKVERGRGSRDLREAKSSLSKRIKTKMKI